MNLPISRNIQIVDALDQHQGFTLKIEVPIQYSLKLSTLYGSFGFPHLGFSSINLYFQAILIHGGK